MTKPNVVYVLTDDTSYGDLGCTGNNIVNTPNIDELYGESVHFTNFHVGPTCAPTRSGLMTGHYANSTGVWHTVGGRSLLRKNEWTIANAFKEAGYTTGIFGKWHLGDEAPYRPYERGFDVSIVHGGGGISQTPDFWGNDYFDDTYSVNGEYKQFKGYCTDVFFEEAKKFITDNKDKPFFCYLPTNAPHGPYNVARKYSDKYMDKVSDSMAKFYGMMENIDENVGSMREFLKEIGIADNTIFMYMTDNGTGGGAAVDKDGFLTKGLNGGFRGKKGSPYEGGHRVPFFMHWKDGNLTTARDIDEVTANVDFMPTLLDLCGIEVSKDVSFHGTSMKPLIEGDNSNFIDRVIVTDSQRISTPVKWRESAVCSDEWRLINGKELYKIREDKEQRDDVASKYPEVVEKLRGEYDKWWDIVSTQIAQPIPISVGTEEMLITCHDAVSPTSKVAWMQGHVRNAMVCNGHYEIDVTESGKYRIECRRWSRETDVAICDEIAPENDVEFEKDGVLEEEWYNYQGSTAMFVGAACIKVQDKSCSKVVEKDDKAAVFEIELEKGITTLEPTFTGRGANEIFIPYYTYIVKI
ncbi:MAG: arylsulfatase [Clostridia bacterium]